MSAATAYVGLGSNLAGAAGDSRAQVLDAIAGLARLRGTRVGARSSLYRSAPLGHEAQPEFVNAVVRLETTLSPEELLDELLALERRHGRERSFRDAPRTLDLDLLLYGDTSLSGERLTLPHPRMHERAFVLAPLVEIAPDAVIPGRGRAADLLHACAGQHVQRA